MARIMARQLRQFKEGLSVHVIHRGNNRQTIFADDHDCEWFLTLLREAFAENRVAIHGHVLMKNHYHLQVTPADEDSLPDGMQQLGIKYVRYFNRKHGRVGHLFSARPREIVIEDERYWLTCLRYIEQNPVRAGIVTAPEDYRWSSYRTHAFGEPCSWLTPHPCYLALGGTEKERQVAYRAIADPTLSSAELVPVRLAAAGAP
jgi:REP-associated tyrosine transposase